MMTRIRRVGLTVSLALLLLATALAGVAWAANTIHCPGATSGNLDGECGARIGTTSCTVPKGRTRCGRGGERTSCTGAAGATYSLATRGRTSPTAAPVT